MGTKEVIYLMFTILYFKSSIDISLSQLPLLSFVPFLLDFNFFPAFTSLPGSTSIHMVSLLFLITI